MQAYKFDLLKKTQLKEKTQGFNEINVETERNYRYFYFCYKNTCSCLSIAISCNKLCGLQ